MAGTGTPIMAGLTVGMVGVGGMYWLGRPILTIVMGSIGTGMPPCCTWKGEYPPGGPYTALLLA